MNKALREKLIGISLTDLLFPLVFFTLGFVANKYIEDHKLVQAARVEDTTEYKKACQEIWAKVYEYESNIDKLDKARSSRWFQEKLLKDSNLAKVDKEIEKVENSADIQLKELESLTNKYKFVVGDKLAIHFWQYIGLVKQRSEARQNALEVEGYSFDIDNEAIDSFNKILVRMRFTAADARELALSRLPN